MLHNNYGAIRFFPCFDDGLNISVRIRVISLSRQRWIIKALLNVNDDQCCVVLDMQYFSLGFSRHGPYCKVKYEDKDSPRRHRRFDPADRTGFRTCPDVEIA